MLAVTSKLTWSGDGKLQLLKSHAHRVLCSDVAIPQCTEAGFAQQQFELSLAKHGRLSHGHKPSLHGFHSNHTSLLRQRSKRVAGSVLVLQERQAPAS